MAGYGFKNISETWVGGNPPQQFLKADPRRISLLLTFTSTAGNDIFLLEAIRAYGALFYIGFTQDSLKMTYRDYGPFIREAMYVNGSANDITVNGVEVYLL